MKKFCYLLLGFSVIVNIVLGVKWLINSSNKKEQEIAKQIKEDEFIVIQEKAKDLLKQWICEDLYYPMTYDPVKTKIDSVFYSPLTDQSCIGAAVELIKLRQNFTDAKSRYEDAIEHINFFHSANVGIPTYGKKRDMALKEMNELQQKIKEKKKIIKSRDNSQDGNFIGWQFRHRYRASNSDGVVYFGNVLYIVDSNLSRYYYRFSLEENDRFNANKIRDIIIEVLNEPNE